MQLFGLNWEMFLPEYKYGWVKNVFHVYQSFYYIPTLGLRIDSFIYFLSLIVN